ncbi:hypothetical protein [uncultured Hymenobacter sp.]|uniref:hypothetical protein n=1 Tax=uncultured Hymenobacter sp. TaxID=170016 RepID=UPI0035CB4D80
MADTPDFARLADTLISRQDQHQQQLDRLTALAANQDEMNRRLEGSALRSEELHRSAAETHRRLDAGLAEAQATNRRLDAGLAETQATNRRLDAGLVEAKEMNRRLDASLARTDEVLATFGQIQLRMLDEMEKLRAEQVRSNRVQEEFAKRQDEFNVVFLEEIRHIKQDARVYHAQTTLTMQQYDERLKRLEDFMNGFQSAA